MPISASVSRVVLQKQVGCSGNTTCDFHVSHLSLCSDALTLEESLTDREMYLIIDDDDIGRLDWL